MSEAILDWKEAMTRVDTTRGLYVKRLRNFIETERDISVKVSVALKNGRQEEARAMVHATREAAAELGGKALAAAALELEMAIKAGADTTAALHRFDSVTTDTLVAMATVAAQ